MEARLKRLYYDLEVSPNLVLAWKTGYKVCLNHDSIVKERSIICIGYKWAGETSRKVLTWDSEQCDKKMITKFSSILADADECVAYFGDSFDLPWLRARALYHGIIIPEVKSVDPLKWARKRYAFNSNKLDYVAKFLGAKGKVQTNYKLWKDITLHNCPKALKKMSRYCANDLVLLEFVHNRLQEMTPPVTHKGVFMGLDKWTCPWFGHGKVYGIAKRVSVAGVVKHQMRCGECRRHYTINARSYQEWEESKLP